MSTWVGQLLKRLGIVQRGSNINFIRHAVSTEFYFWNDKPTAKLRLLFAERMAHSPDMSRLYIRKISEQKL
jgi:hypothetical protein